MRAHLVRTEAGLQIHRAAVAPALADREFAGEQRGVMGIVCSGCKRGLGIKACVPAMHGRTSHSICPACAAAVLAEASNLTRINMSNTVVLPRHQVAEIVGPEAMVLVSRIDHAEMIHGVHWKWTGSQVFTEEGIKLLIDRLAEVDGGASLALRAAAKKIFAPAPVASAPAVAPRALAHAMPERSRADGYQPQEENA